MQKKEWWGIRKLKQIEEKKFFYGNTLERQKISLYYLHIEMHSWPEKSPRQKKLVKSNKSISRTKSLAWTFLNFLAHCEMIKRIFFRREERRHLIMPLKFLNWIFFWVFLYILFTGINCLYFEGYNSADCRIKKLHA